VLVTDLLAEVISRASFRAIGARDGDQQSCVDDHRWPGHEFTVSATQRNLRAYIDSAVEDVEHLWPGRDQEDGAISLAAINLESAIAGRNAAPERVHLTRSRWVAEPPDTPIRFDVEPGGSYEWRAAPRDSRPAGDPD
jgi:hypothetical protein